MRARVALILCIAACGAAPPPKAAPSTELAGALEPLGWWLGDWQAATGTEHWIAAAGAIYGVALHDADFEVMIVDDGDGRGAPDGVVRFIAMPGGARAVEFRRSGAANTTVTFANPDHDFPKSITYTREGDRLQAVLGGDGAQPERFTFTRTTTARAPELEAADRARDTAARAPIASAVRGDLGFTVGTVTGPESGRSSYVTIWKRQSDGAWKAVFDTGRIVNDSALASPPR